MLWEVIWSDKAAKQLDSLGKDIARRIRDGVLDIRENPYRATKRLKSSKFFSLRVGDYRVILDLRRGQMTIFVVSTSGRGHSYDRL